MSTTEIEWTDSTWNPVVGCNIVSAGCTNCYAMNMTRRLASMKMSKYKGLTRISGGKVVWTGKVRLDEGSLGIPYKWKKPRKIFVNSMSDLFHEAVSLDFIRAVWKVMKETPQHHYQILTKRPERMAQIVSLEICDVLPNVWLGTSVEAADVADRIENLRHTPAAIRFVSFEPLISSVGNVDLSGIDWAIVGGESGPRSRRVKEEWIDEIFDQCSIADTAFFFKQWGSWGSDNKRRSKKANGRTYKGKHWDDMPIFAADLKKRNCDVQEGI